MRAIRPFLVVLISSTLVSLATAAGAAAVTITPTVFTDGNSANGNCTLREAVIAANTDASVDACAAGAGADEIPLAAGTYALSIAGDGEDDAATGDLDVNESLTVIGAGATATTIDAGGGSGVFEIDPDGNLGVVATIAELKITDGAAEGSFAGGAVGVKNDAVLKLAQATVTENAAASGGFNAGGVHSQDDARTTIIESVISGNTATGIADFRAGGVTNLNQAETTIEGSTISGNSAAGDYSGGGVHNENEGRMEIFHTTISGNTASGRYGGGGFHNENDATMTIEASTVSGNSATYALPLGDGYTGGGGVVLNDSVTTLRNSTVSDNSSALGGGGITSFNDAALAVENSTIAGNTATTEGGGILDNTFPGSAEPLASLASTILAANSGGGGGASNCAVSATSNGFASLGYNLEDADTCGLGASGDIKNGTPALGPLADNGGPTQTRSIGENGDAYNAGPPAGSTMGSASGLSCPPPGTDQRGITRPQSGVCDIGAFELEPASVGACGAAITINGTLEDDKLSGTPGKDVVAGGPGNDVIKGGGGKDKLCGHGGKDRVVGGGGKDALRGDEGADKLKGGAGKDTHKGGSGNDELSTADGERDKVNCGPGKKDKARVDAKDKVSKSCEKVRGGSA